MAVGCASSALGVIMILCANIILTVIEVNTIGVDARLFLQIFILLILVWITFTIVRTMQSILLFLKELGESGDYTANSFVPGMTMSESLDATA
uniref:Uncharacterized protein n=1 Tax=Compsopogon caeruleus TaxID=31354 RepID=A0A7S1XFY9_9RHOD